MPAEVLTPATEEAIAEAVAGSGGQALRLRGGGTRSDIGRPVQAARVLSLAGHSGITLYEPGALTMVVKTGTTMAEVEAALEAENQQLAFEPMDHRALLGTTGEPTVGAVVAGNVSGPRRVRAGACRDHLLGARFVDGRGRVVKNGGRVMKNVTGLDLAKLMCGAWGTLGVLSEVSLKTLPVAETACTLRFAGLDADGAVALFCAALRTPYEIAGAAWIDGSAYLRIEGLAVQVENRSRALSALFQAHEIERIDGEAHGALWRGIRDVTHFAARPGAVWRLAAKPTDAPGIVAALGAAGAECSLDWGGGLIWARVPQEADQDVRRHLPGSGAHATLVRGCADHRGAVAVFQPEHPRLAKISAALRHEFDPDTILNPGLMA